MKTTMAGMAALSPVRTPSAALTGIGALAQALRESEERLRMVVRSAPVVLWAVDSNGVFTFLEGRGLAHFEGISAKVGRSAFELYARRPEVIANLRRVLAGEEFRLVVDDPNHGAFETLFSPVRDAGGAVVGAMGISTNVTERRRAEETLRESEEKFKKVFHGSPVAISINSMKGGRYTDVNEEFLRLTARTREEVLGKTPDDLGIEVAPEQMREVRAAMFRRGAVRNLEAEIRNRDGSVRSAVFSAAIMELRGEPCVLSFLHDVTERKETERSLRQVSGLLLRSQDEERRRIARELHDSTAQMLAGVAMNLKLVESAMPSDERGRRALQEASMLVAQCTSEIRTLSYLLHPPMLDEIGLGSALRGYVEGFAKRSGIALTLEIPDSLERLPADIEMTIFRIVQESLTNIHRHSGSPTGSVRITTGGGEVVLEVRDEGRGAPADAFDVRGSIAGLGVGVAGMRERVRQFHGRLDIDSGPGGTVVRAALPLWTGK